MKCFLSSPDNEIQARLASVAKTVSYFLIYPTVFTVISLLPFSCKLPQTISTDPYSLG